MSESEIWEEILSGRMISNPIDIMLSDAVASDIVSNYFNKVIRKGDYYTLEVARRKIESEKCHQKIKDRLIHTLNLVKRCRGISKAKVTLQGKELEDFKRSLRDLDKLGINPVTIPREWGIQHIPNLFDAYCNKIANEQVRNREEQWRQEISHDYFRDRKA